MRSCAAQQVEPPGHAHGQVVQPAGAMNPRQRPATQTSSRPHTLPQVPQW